VTEFGEKALDEEAVCLHGGDDGGDAGEIFFCGSRLAHESFGRDVHDAEGHFCSCNGGGELDSDRLVGRVDREAFLGWVPGVAGRQMEESRDITGVAEVQLQGDAPAIRLSGNRAELRGTEEVLGIVEGVDEEFGEWIALGQGTCHELIEIVSRGVAFSLNGSCARPVAALESDGADGFGEGFPELVELGEGAAGWFFDKDGFACFQEPGEDVVVGFGVCAYEDAGDLGVGGNGFEIVGKRAAREERGQLWLPVRLFCADVFEVDIEMAEDGIQVGHAMDAKADKGISFLREEERGLEISFLSVGVEFIQERVEHAGRRLSGQVP